MKTRQLIIKLSVFIIMCTGCICLQCASASATLSSTDDALTGITDKTIDKTTENIAVKELDLGEYQTEMTVGDRQLLYATVLPSNASCQELTYTSSNTSIATINGMGRITAVSMGTTAITVVCDKITAGFTLTVKEKAVTENAAVTDIDMGDYPKELEVGSSQLLGATVIPTNAANQNITYSSSDETKATVNALGRITGVATGKVRITAVSGAVTRSVRIKIIAKKPDKIAVAAIDISNHEDNLEVDKTVSLTATVTPSDATSATVTYSSSNDSIATVSSSGEVKGISKGNVTIKIKAGDITKKVHLKIIVATTRISMNSTYLVLKPDETYQLKADVLPAQADQSISYHSQESEIFNVTRSGLVTAKKCGNGNIIVSNEDFSTSVTVIVNKDGEGTDKDKTYTESKTNSKYPELLNTSEQPVISSEMLRYYYENSKIITIQSSGYSMQLNGSDILNCDNILYTDLQLKSTRQGTEFTLNNNEKLCGKVTLILDNHTGKYLYLYNNSKKTYEQLEFNDINHLTLEIEGRYLITEEPISTLKINKAMFGMAVGVVVLLIAVYIFVKKRYWFW